MLARLTFILITIFWLAMNVLLWRSEYGPRSGVSSPVPAEFVWRKILNAPDESSLSILYRGKRAGYFHLKTGVSDEFATLEDAPSRGLKTVNRVHFDGSFSIPEQRGRLRFESDLLLSKERTWKQFKLRVVRRPVVIELLSEAANDTVRVTATDGETRYDRTFTVAEFKNPMSLLEGLMGPLAAGMLSGIQADVIAAHASADEPVLIWEAYEDTLAIANQTVRVYRLQTRVMDRYNIVFFVSRAGELLKAELPNGIVLVHDKTGMN